MSNGYGCEFCDGANPVAWLITNLPAGSTLSACADDFPVAMIPVIAGELGADAEGLYDVIKAYVDQVAAQAKIVADDQALNDIMAGEVMPDDSERPVPGPVEPPKAVTGGRARKPPTGAKARP